MGFFDRLFGRADNQSDPRQQQRAQQPQGYNTSGDQPPGQTTDQQAIERYRYLLRTAPPETIEQAHEEAFAQLTPEQRRMVLQQLTEALPANERNAGVSYGDDPRSLARMATRAELRQPGTLERTFSGIGGPGMGMGTGVGLGGLMAGSFLSSLAGVVAGSMIANAFFDHSGYNEGYGEGYSDANAHDQDAGYDQGTGDNADMSGDYGDMGSDMGGDFGGGDFGGDF